MRVYFDVYFNARKVNLLTSGGNEVPLFVQRRPFVKAGYVAIEFAVAELNFVVFGYNPVVAVYRVNLVHKVYAVGFYAHTYRTADWRRRSALYYNFKLAALDGYFVMHALKHRRYDRAFKLSFPRSADFNILGTDDDVDKLVNLVIVEAVESRPAEFDFKFSHYRAVEYVAFANKVRNEGVDGFVINLVGRAYLLYFAVVNYYYFVRHSKRLFLVVRDVDKGYAEALVHLFKLYLHLLAHFKVKRAQRLV